MALIVQKFGGTSVGSVERIEAVADRLAKHRARGESLVVVVSAMSGETNRLMGLAEQLSDNPHHGANARELDVLLSTGEQVTIALLSMALHKRGVAAKSYTGAQVKVLTDSNHTKARIEDIEDRHIRADLDAGTIVIVAGFQGVDAKGNITTLGRGGSDTSAVALAAALNAQECQIYTDVDGVYTTDPRVEPKARKLDKITFEEMLEMASLGSKVLQIRAVEFAGKYQVPLRVLSSFDEALPGPDAGTLITVDPCKEGNEKGDNTMEQPVVSGIAFHRDEAKITVSGIDNTPGSAAKLLAPIGQANIEVDVIVQNAGSDGCADLGFTLSRQDVDTVVELLKQSELAGLNVSSDTEICKVSVVGVGMRSHAGVAAAMFEALAREGINIQMISTSEIKISVIIEEKYLELAVRSLHQAFGLEEH